MRRSLGIVSAVAVVIMLGLVPSFAQDATGSERIAFTTETDPNSGMTSLHSGVTGM